MKKNNLRLKITKLIVQYIVGILIFTVFTIPTTKVNGSRVGFRLISSMGKNFTKGDKVEIKGKNDQHLIFPLNEINYTSSIDTKKYKQGQLLWIFRFFKPIENELEISSSFDYEKLKSKLLDSFIGDKGTPPKNATIEMGEDGKFKIVPEEYGTELNIDKVMDKVISSLENNPKGVIDISDEYKKPTITADNENLKKQLDARNKLADMKITYDFMYTQEVLEGETLVSMYDEVDGKLVANPERSKKYLIELAIKYDTFGSSRKFKAKDIGEITVPAGIYGWEIAVDKSNEVLLEKLNNYESAELTPEYRIEGVYRDEYNDIGNTYVEVDIARQHMWYFKDGEQVFDAPFVSGRDTDSRRTPLGVNQLWSKQKDTYLEGSSWRTHVDYWMPIDWTGVGFHDAKWRSSFGGDIWRSNGSHGCLNMPPAKAKEFYNMVELNTPVVVYDSNKL